MIYVIIALAMGITTSLLINYWFIKDAIGNTVRPFKKVVYTQSDRAEETKDHDNNFRASQKNKRKRKKETKTVSVAMVDGQAYWVDSDDGLMTAPLDENQEVEHALGHSVDAYTLSDDEIDYIMAILDALKEVEDDSSSAGEQDV